MSSLPKGWGGGTHRTTLYKVPAIVLSSLFLASIILGTIVACAIIRTRRKRRLRREDLEPAIGSERARPSEKRKRKTSKKLRAGDDRLVGRMFSRMHHRGPTSSEEGSVISESTNDDVDVGRGSHRRAFLKQSTLSSPRLRWRGRLMALRSPRSRAANASKSGSAGLTEIKLQRLQSQLDDQEREAALASMRSHTPARSRSRGASISASQSALHLPSQASNESATREDRTPRASSPAATVVSSRSHRTSNDDRYLAPPPSPPLPTATLPRRSMGLGLDFTAEPEGFESLPAYQHNSSSSHSSSIARGRLSSTRSPARGSVRAVSRGQSQSDERYEEAEAEAEAAAEDVMRFDEAHLATDDKARLAAVIDRAEHRSAPSQFSEEGVQEGSSALSSREESARAPDFVLDSDSEDEEEEWQHGPRRGDDVQEVEAESVGGAVGKGKLAADPLPDRYSRTVRPMSSSLPLPSAAVLFPSPPAPISSSPPASPSRHADASEAPMSDGAGEQHVTASAPPMFDDEDDESDED